MKRLLEIVNSKQASEQSPEKVVSAIKELGQRKEVSAIPALVKLLTFKDKSKERGDGIWGGNVFETGPWAIYPAIDALFSIGKPALPDLIKVIEQTNSDTQASENALTTIMSIYSGDVPGGIKYLEAAAAKSSTPEGQQRLISAAEKARSWLR